MRFTALSGPAARLLVRSFDRTENRRVDGIIFDLDGTVYRGDTPMPGARELFSSLRAEGLPFVFLSNNSAESSRDISLKLSFMGIYAEPERIVLAAEHAGEFLSERFGPSRIYVLGSDSLVASLYGWDHTVLEDGSEGCDAVLVGLDRSFTYGRLAEAVALIHGGARFVATNPDGFHPGTGFVPVPETGAIIAAISAATGSFPLVLGKPGPWLFRKALRILGTKPERTAMVGDNPRTDVMGAKGTGLIAVHLASEGALASPDADYHAASLSGVASWLGTGEEETDA